MAEAPKMTIEVDLKGLAEVKAMAAKIKRMQKLLRNMRHLIPHDDKKQGCRGCRLVAKLDAEL